MSVNPIPHIFLDLLPSVQACESFVLGHDELLIHSPGFEDRTMAVTNAIVPRAGSKCILIEYVPHNQENRLADVRSALFAKGITTTQDDILAYNRFDPGDFELRLEERIIHHGVIGVTVNISSMSKLAILLILGVCYKLRVSVKVFYAEATAYGPTQTEFEEAQKRNEIQRPTLQVYTGVHGVVRINSLASVAMQGQPTAAIVFMSFNNALTQVLLNTVYPSRLLLVNSRPPVHRWRETATAWIHDQVRREWEHDNPLTYDQEQDKWLPERVVSTLQYDESVAALIESYWELSAKNRILLAPSGSKMQTVGCYIVKALHPDIHIEYPSPEGFAREYSSGIGKTWLVDFGNLLERITAIAEVERRHYLEIDELAEPLALV